jgi:hypothetical protein
MSQTSQSKTKMKHHQMLSSGAVDRGPGLLKPPESSLPTTASRSLARHAGTASVGTPYKTAVLNTNDAATTIERVSKSTEPWMETATPGKFANFQQTVFAIVEEIVNKPEIAQHIFTKKWTQLRRASRNPMSAMISWRSVRLSGFNDIFAYKDFIQQCPTIA